MDNAICDNKTRYLAYIKELLFHKKINKNSTHLKQKYNISDSDAINVKQLIHNIKNEQMDSKVNNNFVGYCEKQCNAASANTTPVTNDFEYRYRMYPVTNISENEVHNNKNKKGGKQLINNMDLINEVEKNNKLKILNESQIKMKTTYENCRMNNLPDYVSKINSEGINVSYNKKNKTYNNPFEHYFDYVASDIQDPNHVVMEYPKLTRLSNKNIGKK